MFNDEILVTQGVLLGLDYKVQTDVYRDPHYGMDSVVKLTNWFIASNEGSESIYYSTLSDYFGLTDDQMKVIVGPDSMIAMISH